MGIEAFNRYSDAEKQGMAGRTIFTDLMDENIDPAMASNESKNLLIAGSDTTMVTLTYLIWAILKHPPVKDKLVHEIEGLAPGYSIGDAEDLPYLQLVIQESLRLYGAGPGSLPRAVPHDGAFLCGYHLPKDTVVSTQAYVMHRDPTIYPDPLT